MTRLDDATLEKVREKIEKLTPLYPDIRYTVEIVNSTKGFFNVKAPHYLVFSSEEKEGAYENIGFVGQQLDLFFSEAGIGACWLGVSKPEEKGSSEGLIHVICMSFGKPDGPLYRTRSEFKRKAAEEISEGSDKRLEAARLAPSATNAQNWFFAAQDGKIHCYRKKSNPLLGFLFDKMHIIDMGIAICHISVESEEFCFSKDADAPERKWHVYMGTVWNRDLPGKEEKEL
jgi:hypothetical protein